MADVAVTNTFTTNTTISSSQVNTNFSDLVNFINNRNNAVSNWAALGVTGNALIGGTLGVTGAATLSSTLLVSGIATFTLAPVFSALTATTVPYLGAGKALTSSAVTPTELGYVSGVTSALQTQLNAKQATITTLAVANGGTGIATKIFVKGTYTGNGATQNIAHGLGATPDFVLISITGSGSNIGNFFITGMSGNSHDLNGSNQTNAITTVDGTNISLGANTAVNQNAVAYAFIAYKAQ